MSPVAASPDVPTVKPNQRVHLAYLDGIRGLAALYVVLHHVWQTVAFGPNASDLPGWFRAATILKFGGLGVVVFIVVSGYCLMLPVVRSVDHTLQGGLAEFVRRRGRRILPPYFACLLFSIIIWVGMGNILTIGDFTSHLLLLHNLFISWRWTINGPLWSVGLEWQIYFLFALILLPIWQKFGSKGSLIAASLIGFAPLFFALEHIKSWFVLLFAVGMTAASLNFCAKNNQNKIVKRVPWLILCVVGIGAAVIVHKGHDEGDGINLAITHSLIGIAVAALLVDYTQRLLQGKSIPIVGSLLTNRYVVGLGAFSYSLYLVHYPLLALFNRNLSHFGLTPAQNFIALLTVFTPGVVLIAFLFHQCFERPFMRKA